MHQVRVGTGWLYEGAWRVDRRAGGGAAAVMMMGGLRLAACRAAVLLRW